MVTQSSSITGHCYLVVINFFIILNILVLECWAIEIFAVLPFSTVIVLKSNYNGTKLDIMVTYMFTERPLCSVLIFFFHSFSVLKATAWLLLPLLNRLRLHYISKLMSFP